MHKSNALNRGGMMSANKDMQQILIKPLLRENTVSLTF